MLEICLCSSRASAGVKRVRSRCVWQRRGQGLRSHAHPHHTRTVCIASICQTRPDWRRSRLKRVCFRRHTRSVAMFVPEPTWRLQKFTRWDLWLSLQQTGSSECCTNVSPSPEAGCWDGGRNTRIPKWWPTARAEKVGCCLVPSV